VYTPNLGCLAVAMNLRTWSSNSSGVVPFQDRATACSRGDTTFGSWVRTPAKNAVSPSMIAL
jgi:hypothetical protein